MDCFDFIAFIIIALLSYLIALLNYRLFCLPLERESEQWLKDVEEFVRKYKKEKGKK